MFLIHSLKVSMQLLTVFFKNTALFFLHDVYIIYKYKMIPLSNIHRVNFYPPSPAHTPQHFIVFSESCSHSTARAGLSQTHSDSPSLDSPLLELEMNSRSRSNFTLHSVAWVSLFYALYWAVTFNSSEKKAMDVTFQFVCFFLYTKNFLHITNKNATC